MAPKSYINPNSLQKIERFWAHDLGLDSGNLPEMPGVVCAVQHLYSGMQLFRRGPAVIIASPPAKIDFSRNAVRGRSPDDVFSAQWLQSVLGSQAEAIIGPAELNYADATTFRSAPHESARALSEGDSDACQALVSALDKTELVESGAAAGKFPAFGSFCDNVLCAVARYEVWQSSIAHIIVATHPQYRRRGFARSAVQSLAADALGRDLILQWRAVAWNANSLALAASLGFEHYASTMFVRLSDR
jgi:GNAT superfamily N-acetyltransferase